MSNIPQRSRPFADRLAIGTMVTRAANDGGEWICGLVEWETAKFERMPQKFLRLSPYFEMFDNSEHGFQISVDGIACPAGLKLVPRISDLLKPLPNANSGLFALGCAM
jgi:hypothetical protein